MKRIGSFVLALMLVFSSAVAYAESTTAPFINISTLSIEQLQALHTQIDQRLQDQAHSTSISTKPVEVHPSSVYRSG